ncbi:reactive intermediate/imine deaminase [Burkholderia sp. SRS-46]|nr:reactive intermediate/imine deaminase [Burkholderia sp. SRS-46]
MSVIETANAPAAVGPYAQARTCGNLLFVSGQLPIHPETGNIECESASDQMRQCLQNIASIVRAAGSSMANVLKTTILVTDLSRFSEINAAYAEFFAAPYPARATFEVSALPKGALIEVEAVVSLEPAT